MRPDEPLRILAVKLADLGDVLLCEPALRSLREGHPSACIDLLVPPGSGALARLLGQDLNVITFPKALFDRPSGFFRPEALVSAATFARKIRGARYDIIVIFHHLTTRAGALKYRTLVKVSGANVVVGLDNGRGSFLSLSVPDLGFGVKHEVDYMLEVARVAGGAEVDQNPRFSADPVAIPVDLPDRYAVLYPVTGPYSEARTWPAQRFAEVAEELASVGLRSVIVGATDASDAAHVITASAPGAIDLTGRTSIRQLAAVLRGASVVVGGDSFIGHLARALDRPVVAIFGPSNRDAWRPFGTADADTHAQATSSVQRGIVVYHDLPCEPCIYTGFSLGRPAGCRARTCLQRVSAGEVARIVKRIAEVG
jgi:heptosyltransferase-2